MSTIDSLAHLLTSNSPVFYDATFLQSRCQIPSTWRYKVQVVLCTSYATASRWREKPHTPEASQGLTIYNLRDVSRTKVGLQDTVDRGGGQNHHLVRGQTQGGVTLDEVD